MIIVKLPFPPSTNTMYPTNQHGGGRHLSKEGAAWKAAAAWECAQAFRLIDAPRQFAVIIRLWFPDNRRRDIDNYVKGIIDVIREALCIDDNWKVIPRLIVEAMGVDKLNPRAEVTILPLDATGTTERGGNSKSSVLV